MQRKGSYPQTLQAINVLRENSIFDTGLIDRLCCGVLRNQHKNHRRAPDGLLAAEETLQHGERRQAVKTPQRVADLLV